MIQANELRAGNYVMHRNKMKSIWQVRYNAIDFLIGFDKKENPFYQSWKLAAIDPVILTEQILLDCGFEIKPFSMGLTFDRFRFIWKENYKYWYVIDKHNQAYYSKIEFVHELQNLIFIMNGKELEIKFY